MAITADHIRATLTAYLDNYPEDKPDLAPVLDLLDEGADISSRQEFRGHATAGAILADAEGRILHIRHRRLDRWLLPGGHLEAQDASLLEAARRELTEETGIPAEAVTPDGDQPLHIDVHRIPARTPRTPRTPSGSLAGAPDPLGPPDAKGEPEHRHVDFRFLFRTTADVRRLQTEEVTDAAWRTIDSLADPALRERLATALR